MLWGNVKTERRGKWGRQDCRPVCAWRTSVIRSRRGSPRSHGGTERGGGELDRMTGLTGCCGFILFLLFILSDTSKGLPRRGGNSLMKKQTRMSAPLLNLESGQTVLTVPLPSSPCLRGLRGESLPLPDFCDAHACRWGVSIKSVAVRGSCSSVSHEGTKARRREEEKKSRGEEVWISFHPLRAFA